MADLPGFSNPDESIEVNNESDNKTRKVSKKGGGFQSMGLGYNILKGITKRGYKQPTPIQRKVSFLYF